MQVFRKDNGEPFLFEKTRIETEYDKDIYTEVMPPSGLYQPIYFDGEKWIGTPYEEWLEQQPKNEVEETPDEKDILIADLTLQLMETQNTVVELQNDVANLTLQVLESDNNA